LKNTKWAICRKLKYFAVLQRDFFEKATVVQYAKLAVKTPGSETKAKRIKSTSANKLDHLPCEKHEGKIPWNNCTNYTWKVRNTAITEASTANRTLDDIINYIFTVYISNTWLFQRCSADTEIR